MRTILTVLFVFFLGSTAWAEERASAIDETLKPANPVDFSVFETHDPNSRVAIKHDYWDLILSGIVFESSSLVQDISSEPPPTGSRVPRSARIPKTLDINYIPYGTVKSDFKHIVEALDVYLMDVRQIDVTKLNRNEQLAFWLNVRNALVVQTIFSSYPVTGDNLQALYFGKGGAWTKPRIRINGQHLSIEDIEERIILTNWNDPLVVYGLFYGTEGGPFILTEAFWGDNVYNQLEKSARRYINASRTVNFSKKMGVVLPIIYVWHSDIFGNRAESVLEHVKKFADDDLKARLDSNTSVEFAFDFDWDLNDMSNRLIKVQGNFLRLRAISLEGCSEGASSAICVQ